MTRLPSASGGGGVYWRFPLLSIRASLGHIGGVNQGRCQRAEEDPWAC